MKDYRARLNAMMARYMRYSMMHGWNPNDMETEFGRMYTSLFMEHQMLRTGEALENEGLLERAEQFLQEL